MVHFPLADIAYRLMTSKHTGVDDMDGKAAQIASLTEAEREVLRVFLEHSEIKEVARVLGKSIYAVEQRLARARRRLGVRRSVDAAHILARAENRDLYPSTYIVAGELYDTPIYASPDVAKSDQTPFNDGDAEEDGHAWSLPFPTKGRPWNAFPIWGRVAVITGGVLIVTASALLATALLEVVTRIVRQIS